MIIKELKVREKLMFPPLIQVTETDFEGEFRNSHVKEPVE